MDNKTRNDRQLSHSTTENSAGKTAKRERGSRRSGKTCPDNLSRKTPKNSHQNGLPSSKRTKRSKKNPKHRNSTSREIRYILRWERPYRPPAVEDEEKMLPLLLKYGEKERGMMKNQHYLRIKSIRDACREYRMTLDQALSMRRTHMMLLNPQLSFVSALRLGRQDDIRQSAKLFEEAVGQFLMRQGIPFFSEEEQRERQKANTKTKPTPDFLMKETVNLNSRPIKWIEAKMFYGASTVPDGSKNAVGNLMRTAKRYVEAHGPGAFVFSFGFGIRIKQMLEAEGVVVLDAKPLDLQPMREHQRTWCANQNGQILP